MAFECGRIEEKCLPPCCMWKTANFGVQQIPSFTLLIFFIYSFFYNSTHQHVLLADLPIQLSMFLSPDRPRRCDQHALRNILNVCMIKKQTVLM